MRAYLTVEQRQLALRLKARGLSLREIGPQVGCSHQGVALIARNASRWPVRRDGWVPGPGWLTVADRKEITLGVHARESFTVIAARLGKAVSTVSREAAANGGRGGYSAPTTLKFWLTKTWCGQLTPMQWTSYSPLLSLTTRSTTPPG
jgi:IS30 family transposase